MDFNEDRDVIKNLIDVPSQYDWFPYEYIDTEVKKKPKKKNCKCLWCTKVFQGINANNALAQVLGKKGMYVISCYVIKEKVHITRY